MSLYNKLSVAVLPIDIAAGRKEDNLKMASDAIGNLPYGIDLAVLPELFTTAFVPDKDFCSSLAEGNDGPTMQWAFRTAKAKGAAIAGSFLARESGRLCNRAFLVEPSGDAIFYDKRHTFSIGRESEVISKGDCLPPIARFRGWNIALFVCYDLRFPAWMRNIGLKYDLMLVPANWPKSRAFAWEHLLQARAIENQAYVIGANRSGTDEYGVYDDMARIYDYNGRPLGAESRGCVHAVLSKDSLEKMRAAMPVHRDADDFILKIH